MGGKTPTLFCIHGSIQSDILTDVDTGRTFVCSNMLTFERKEGWFMCRPLTHPEYDVAIVRFLWKDEDLS
jgi:hypothetical protein